MMNRVKINPRLQGFNNLASGDFDIKGIRLFNFVAADRAYIKNTAAAASENRLYHFFIVG